MNTEINPLYFAFTATICFAYASTIFTEFTRKTTPFWMNSFKAIIAFFAFLFTLLLTNNWIPIEINSVFLLLSSGCIGLMIGDIFMLKAMAELGASRMLMIFGLQPFLLGVSSYFIFNHSFSLVNIIGVIFMSLCLFTISLEKYKQIGHWQASGLIAGLIAISLDATGVILTRISFNQTPGITSIQVNLIRCAGAVLGFFLIYFFKEKISFTPTWNNFSKNEKIKIVFGSILGTFLSLMLYLVAVSKGKLSIISSVSVTGPMFAAAFECVKGKKLPSKYLILSFFFFVCGFFIFLNYA